MKLFSNDRKHARELAKKVKEEEKRIENELPPEDKMNPLEYLRFLLEKSEEDIEYESMLTEEELEQEKKSQKEEKRILIIALTTMATAVIITCIFVTTYYNLNKSDLLKITQPMLEEYYFNTYNTKAKITSIEEFSYVDENRQEVKTGIVLATTSNNEHLMTINNELIGDDISISKTNEAFLEYMNPLINSENLIYQNVELSYQDYYIQYNRFIDYIDTLPSNHTLEQLLQTNKLTATYKLVYQHNIDYTPYYNVLQTLSDDSVFYFLQHEVGLPTNLTVMTKTKTYSMDVSASIEKEKDIIYYELSRNTNGVGTLDLSTVNDSAVRTTGNYDITNVFTIDIDGIRQNRDEEQKPTYYLLKFNALTINQNNLKQISDSKDSDNYYKELEIEDYKDVVLIDVGGHTYLIAQDDLGFGIKTNKKSFLCNLGIC